MVKLPPITDRYLAMNAAVFQNMADRRLAISTQGKFCLHMREAARQLHNTGRLTDTQLAQLLGDFE